MAAPMGGGALDAPGGVPAEGGVGMLGAAGDEDGGGDEESALAMAMAGHEVRCRAVLCCAVRPGVLSAAMHQYYCCTFSQGDACVGFASFSFLPPPALALLKGCIM